MARTKDMTVTHPVEEETFCFDFSNSLDADDYLVGSPAPVWDIAVVADECDEGAEDATPEDHLLGSPINATTPDSGDRVIGSFQRIGGLEPGVMYRIGALVRTQSGDKKYLYAHVKCESPS